MHLNFLEHEQNQAGKEKTEQPKKQLRNVAGQEKQWQHSQPIH